MGLNIRGKQPSVSRIFFAEFRVFSNPIISAMVSCFCPYMSMYWPLSLFVLISCFFCLFHS